MQIKVKPDCESIRLAVLKATGEHWSVTEYPVKEGAWGHLHACGQPSIPFCIHDGVISLKICEFCGVLIYGGTRCYGCWECAMRLEDFVRSPAARVFVYDTLLQELLRNVDNEADEVTQLTNRLKQL